MTPKQILDSFSETLMRDDRILSPRERELLTSLLHHAKSATHETEQTQEAVQRVIASAVGETVAQRAFSVLGGSIVQHILEGSAASRNEGGLANGEHLHGHSTVRAEGPKPPGPQPPGSPLRAPGIPAPSPGPQPPGSPLRVPTVPAPVRGPQPPGTATTTTVVSGVGAAVENLPKSLRARCVALDEFLAPQELAELMGFTLEHEADFQASEVVSPSSERGVVNYDHRRSRVLMDLGPYQDLLLNRIKTVLPDVLPKLGMSDFDIAGVEMQITASNDGDYFHFHSDNGSDRVASRHLTFVYFFHHEPAQFEGGELRIHDSHLEKGAYVSDGTYQTVIPRQNQIVFFPCELMHEVTPVKCSTQSFTGSRFTLNGWLRR